jgi:predicted nucleic acid-binding protein
VYTLDTNIIIYYGNGDPSVQLFIHEQLANSVPLYISTATEHELFSYAHLTDREADDLDALLDTMTVMDLDSRLARFSGRLRAKYGIKSLDSFIAATALITGTTLVTRNVRDFQRIPNLDIHRL